MRDPYRIINTIKLTEKSTAMSEDLNKYVFDVARDATKTEVASAIETIFKKKVKAVNTMNVSGKKKRQRRADYGRTRHWKKAIVTLKEGESFDLV